MALRVSLTWISVLICNAIFKTCGTTSLDLSGSDLHQSTLGPLDAYPGLTSLTLDSNNFTNFPNLTDVADTLKTLYLRYNPITALDQDEINNGSVTLPGVLETLDMTGCQLTVFPNLTFLLGSLKNIFLNKNMIASVPSIHLQGMSIENLELNENSLDEWPAAIHDIRDTLNKMQISSNPMEHITLPSNTPPLKLKTFYMTPNSLVLLPAIASVFGTSLTDLYFSTTTRPGWGADVYKSIPNDLFNASFPYLRFINLSYMKLRHFPKFGPCPKLTFFSYLSNLVDYITLDEFINTPLLNRFTFTYEMKTTIPAFGFMGNFLTSLQISANYKRSLMPDFAFEGNFSELVVLILHNLGLEVFPKLGYMPKLTTLDVRYNLFTYIPCDALDGMASLRILDLENTGIKTLHDVTVQSPLLLTLKLPENQMSCDCTMYWIREQELVHGKLLYDTTLQCGEGEFNGQLLHTLTIPPCNGFGSMASKIYGNGIACDPKRSILVRSGQVSSKIECAVICSKEGITGLFEAVSQNITSNGESSITCKCLKDACVAANPEQRNIRFKKLKKCF